MSILNRLECFLSTVVSTLVSHNGYIIDGHDYIELPNGDLECRNCGYVDRAGIDEDRKYWQKWFEQKINWSDDYCLKHRIDKNPHGYHGVHYSCPLCEKEKHDNNSDGRDKC